MLIAHRTCVARRLHESAVLLREHHILLGLRRVDGLRARDESSGSSDERWVRERAIEGGERAVLAMRLKNAAFVVAQFISVCHLNADIGRKLAG